MKDDRRWNLEIAWHWMIRASRCLQANLRRLHLLKPKNVMKKKFAYPLRLHLQYPLRLAGELLWKTSLSIFYSISLRGGFKHNRNKPSGNLNGQKMLNITISSQPWLNKMLMWLLRTQRAGTTRQWIYFCHFRTM